MHPVHRYQAEAKALCYERSEAYENRRLAAERHPLSDAGFKALRRCGDAVRARQSSAWGNSRPFNACTEWHIADTGKLTMKATYRLGLQLASDVRCVLV